MKLSERCLIHAKEMDDEGWYVTANVLAAAAESLDEMESTMTPADFKAARLALGLSQTSWGLMLGIGKRQVIHIETGTRECSQTIALLVEAIRQGYRPQENER